MTSTPTQTHAASSPIGDTHFDLIVVGAGLAGSAVATALARAGHAVLLLERTHFPRHKVCGEFLSPEAQTTLAALCLRDAVAAQSPCPLTHARLVARNGAELTVPLPGTAWGLSRYVLDETLAQAAVAAGATLRTGALVRRYEEDAGGYTVHYQRDGRAHTAHARTLIMAAGRQSSAGLPPHVDQRRSPDATYVGVKVHMDNVSMPNQVALFMFDGGYVGVNPVEGGKVNVCSLATYAAFTRGGRDAVAMMRTLAAEQPALARLLDGARPVGASASVVAGVDTRRPARPWDDLLCLGDTATMIPPLSGDGMAMALRSAELAAPLTDAYLRGALSLAAWQAAYTEQWHAEFDGRLRTARWLETLLLQPRLNEWTLALGRHMPGLARRFVRMTRGAVAQSHT